MMTLTDLWAKTDPFQSVETHGIVSGIVAQELLKNFLSHGSRHQLCRYLQIDDEELLAFVGYFTSLHDIGKINYYFQSIDPTMKVRLKEDGLGELDLPGFHFRHEVESCRIMRQIWGQVDRRLGRKFAEILGAHHQGKTNSGDQPTADGVWQQMQMEYELLMRERFLQGELLLPQAQKEPEGAWEAMLLGLVILADWIASSSFFSGAEAWRDNETESRLRVSRFLKESHLEQSEISFGKTFYEVWPNIHRGQERELQHKAEELFENCGQKIEIVLMEAPMGEGKTEAGVYAATQMAKQWGKRGFYIALPTSATANQMVGRMRALLEMHHCPENVRLLHAMAWMADSCSEQMTDYSTEDISYAQSWLMPLRRGLLTQYAVGTVDQAMMAAMFIKYGVLRLLGLSGKVLVIDEIHAYDAYMQNILEGLLEWCKALEIPVVLLSATLPPEKKQALLGIFTQETVGQSYPVITAVTEAGKLLEIPFQKVAKHQIYEIEQLRILDQPDIIAKEAESRVVNGGCLCVLMNTVKQAQEVYLALKRRGFSGELLLFHSRFLAERRDEIEKQCLKFFGKDKTSRPNRAILVATQVVEQSLDVDFDAMFTAVAPIDLLIQRMGREFRHEETSRPSGMTSPVFTVLIPGDNRFHADRYVYPECLLRQTIHLLDGRDSIRVPEDVAHLVADGYDTANVPPEELEQWMENLVEREMQGAASDKYKLWPPYKKFGPLDGRMEFDDLERQNYLSAQTRLSEPTVRLSLLEPELYTGLLPRVEQGVLAVTELDLARKILGRSVSIRKKQYEKIANQYGLLDITGDRLIIGVKVLSSDNPCFENDRNLGLLWKE